MTYRPKRLINPGLYAVNDEFLDAESRKPYRGPYHSTYDNQFYTGVDSYDPNKKLLVPNPNKNLPTGISRSNLAKNNSYDNLRENASPNTNLKYGSDPKSFTPNPSPQDYKRGNFTRYFAKRVIEKPNRIIEISEDDYNSLDRRDGRLNYTTWRIVKLLWRIVGKSADDCAKTNKITVDRINSQFFGIKSYLRNLGQFHKDSEDTIESSRTLPPVTRRRGERAGLEGAIQRVRSRTTSGGGGSSPRRDLY